MGSVRSCLAIGCCLGFLASVLEAADAGLVRPVSLQLPSVLRVTRSNSLLPRSNDRPSKLFTLRMVTASGDDAIEFVPPVVVGEPSGRSAPQANDSAGTAGIHESDPFLPPPTESIVPPAPSPAPALSTRPIPLDSFFRDHGDGDSDDEDKLEAPSSRDSFGWIAGTHNNLGMLELDLESIQRVRYDAFSDDKSFKFHLNTPFGARWLSGPDSPDLPPYLFNILISVGATAQVSDRLAFDAVISPGWYSDFSNKGIEAFRLPWHFVSFHKVSDDWQWVLGITDLSRQDIRLLPVAGVIYAPPSGDVRLDLVFPKPKVAWRVCQRKKQELSSWKSGESSGSISINEHEGWLYLAGELGGGSWAISREDRSYDVVTYRDYRLVAGWENRQPKGRASRIEVGWIFGRAVEYQSNNGNYNPPDSLMIRMSTDY